MQELVILKNKEAVTTSLQVAESFKKKHKHVLEAIESIKRSVENSANVEDGSNFGQMFVEGNEPDSYGRSRRVYFMNRDGFSLLAMGFTGSKAINFKLKFIEAFNEMEDVIRKNTVPQTIEDMMIYQLEEMKDVKKDVSMLKDTMRISGQQEFEIKQKGNIKVMEVLGGKESRAYEEISKKVFSKFWSEFKRTFSIPRYGELPRKRFDDAVSFIEMWLPETGIRMEIDQLRTDNKDFSVMKMNRAEALRIGTVIANRWWRHNKPNILSRQHIEKKKAWQQIKKVTQPTKAMSHSNKS